MMPRRLSKHCFGFLTGDGDGDDDDEVSAFLAGDLHANLLYTLRRLRPEHSHDIKLRQTTKFIF